MARLRPGLDPRDADRELDALTVPMREQYLPDFDAVGAAVEPLRDLVAGPPEEPLYLLLGASGLLLIAACTNLASSMLVRGSARAHELAIRAAIGAGRGRLVRQVFTESMLIRAPRLRSWTRRCPGLQRGLLLLAPAGMVPPSGAPFDLRVLGFSLLLTLLTAVLFGLLPAMRMSGVRPARPCAKAPGTAGRGRAGASGPRWWRSRWPWRSSCSAGQGCSSGRSRPSPVSTQDFVPRGLTTLLDLPDAAYPDVQQAVAFHDRLLAALADAPGVVAAG